MEMATCSTGWLECLETMSSRAFSENNMGIEFTTIDFLFNKSNPGDFSATPIGTSMSWVTCFILSAANLALAGFPLTNTFGENLPSRH